jgi:hypothetical protein
VARRLPSDIIHIPAELVFDDPSQLAKHGFAPISTAAEAVCASAAVPEPDGSLAEPSPAG